MAVQGLHFLVIVIIFITSPLISACPFGAANSGCFFTCNCQDQYEICDPDTGACPDSKCRHGEPRPDGREGEFDWRGQGCQIGNVALGKATEQSGTYSTYWSSKAVDGLLEGNPDNTHCAHPSNTENDPAWLWVDLREDHVVYSVTLFNTRNDGGYWRMKEFVIGVGSGPDVHLHPQCGARASKVDKGGSVTVECGSPLIGRYVSFRRTGGKDLALVTICEMVVMGHRKLQPDCNKCDQTNCTNIVGCGMCHAGYKPPLCIERCNGSYGHNCNTPCGHCQNGSENCAPTDGRCETGCQQWYIGDKCDQNISSLGSVSNVTAVAVTSFSVRVDWKQHDIPKELEQYYMYRVAYKQRNAHEFEESSDVPQRAGQTYLSEEITGLTSGVEYGFKVRPYRQMNGQRDRGWADEPVYARTKESTSLPSTSTSTSSTKVPSIGPGNGQNTNTGYPSTSTTTTEANTNTSKSGSNQGPNDAKIPLIVGVVVGAVLVLALVIVAVIFVIRRRKPGRDGLLPTKKKKVPTATLR